MIGITIMQLLSASLKETTTIVSCNQNVEEAAFIFSSHALLVRLVGSTLVFSGTL